MRKTPDWLRYPIPTIGAVVVALLVIAASVGSSSRIFERYFEPLLVVNICVVLALLFYVTAMIAKLVKRYRAGQFGSRMTARIAFVTAVTAIVPCVLIFLVSSQFIGRTIDSWFDVRVEHALDTGVTLSSEILEREQRRFLASARLMGETLAATPENSLQETLDRLSQNTDIGYASIIASGGFTLFASPREVQSAESFAPPTPHDYRTARSQKGFATLEGDVDEPGAVLRIRAIVPLASRTDSLTELSEQELRFLVLTQPIPEALARTVSDLVEGHRDYQELLIARSALRTIYQATLTLTLLLATLVAIAAALSFAKNNTAPIRQLALGTRKVAEGQLHPIQEFSGGSELNALTQSFNSMVEQVAEARRNVENQRAAAERSRAHLERVLENLSSGVLVVSDSLRIDLANAGAAEILSPKVLQPGAFLESVNPVLAEALAEQIRVTENHDFHLEVVTHQGETDDTKTLFVRASRITLDSGAGWVVVFDDMSTMIDAQKALAWGEVARRLAHEIKNPLTPIRLAAERLELKLADQLEGKDKALLMRATHTIVTQVDALKQMVNDFREYAKLPAAQLTSLDLSTLLEELAQLYASAGTNLTLALAEDAPSIEADKNQLRQLFHNLIGNAIDATAELGRTPEITISTHVLRDAAGKSDALRVAIEDNGSGFPETILAKAFEPYITTKPLGTGLGLPMVKKIAEEHHAKVTLENLTDESGAVIGALVTIVFPAAEHAARSRSA